MKKHGDELHGSITLEVDSILAIDAACHVSGYGGHYRKLAILTSHLVNAQELFDTMVDLGFEHSECCVICKDRSRPCRCGDCE